MKKKKISGNIDNIKSAPYNSIENMPISLGIVTMYALLISKQYMGHKAFSWGEKSTAKYEGWGIIGYYEKVSSILGRDTATFNRIILQGIEDSGYDMSLVSNLLSGLELIPTTVIDYAGRNKVTNHYIKGMKTTSGVGGVKSLGKSLTGREVSSSTVLLKDKKDKNVDYYLQELYSILPVEVVNALQDKETIKLVLGNQTEAKRPEIVADYQSTIGVQKPNTLIR